MTLKGSVNEYDVNIDINRLGICIMQVCQYFPSMWRIYFHILSWYILYLVRMSSPLSVCNMFFPCRLHF